MKTKCLHVVLTLSLVLTLAPVPVSAARGSPPHDLGFRISDFERTNPQSHDYRWSGMVASCATTPDDGATVYPTVQEAVDAANEGDTVKIAGYCASVQTRAGVTQTVYVSKTITLCGGYASGDWATSDPAANPTTLDAQGRGRVLYVSGQISPTIEGLRVTGGDATGLGGGLYANDAGGGVYVLTATITISGNHVFSNTARMGGGLYLQNSPATLSGNTVSTNTAGSGGGMQLESSAATLVGNTVSGNTAEDGGGGLYLHDSPVTLSGNTVLSNSTQTGGGGLVLEDSPATLSGNTIQSNNAGHGGGLELGSSTATLSGDTIAHNSADRGGGLYASWGDVTLNGSQIISNTARVDGGGVYVDQTAITFTEASLIAYNAANGADFWNGGGGIFVDHGQVTLSGGQIIGNTAARSGGGVFVDSGQATLSGGQIVSNTADWGGGVFVHFNSGRVVVNEGQVSYNSAGSGGGIGIYSGAVTLNGGQIADNVAQDLGGGVLVGLGRVTSNGALILRNSARRGGGIFVHAHASAALTNTVVADNQAESGIYLAGGSARLCHTTLARNGSALLTTGGSIGLYVANGATTASDVALTNTILVSHSVGVSVTGGSTVTADGVLWFNTPITVSQATTAAVSVEHQYQGDPAFAADGYHLTAGSAAVDRGVDAGVTSDIDGDPRPLGAAPDLGADELVSIYLPLVARHYAPADRLEDLSP